MHTRFLQKSGKATALAAALATCFSAHATNGMLMEGYGPVATAMGGAGMAYANGTAAMMNNPATLALAADGTELNVAFGTLGPVVKSGGQHSESRIEMPAFGLMRKEGGLAFGFGVFAQGGMGTDYAETNLIGKLGSAQGNPLSMGSQVPWLPNRSKVAVGRAMVPVAWKASESLTIGATLDYVMASMDIQMLLDGRTFGKYMSGMSPLGSVSGSLVAGMQSQMGPNPGQIGDVNYGYLNFRNDNPYQGEARSEGIAGKVGMTYAVNPQWTVGASYHSRTRLRDMTSSNAAMSMGMVVNGFGNVSQTLTGRVQIHDFQFPDQLGLGVAYKPDAQWLLVADYRRIGWADVMKSMSLTFDVSNAATNGAYAGAQMRMTMNQNWKDQDVLMLGASYQWSDALVLRGGVSLANNPVPDSLTNPLFPAIVRNHVMAGFGYAFDKDMKLDISLSHAPAVTVTNADGITMSHGQTNAQVMLTKRY